MKNYFKILSLTIALIMIFTGVSIFTASAEDTYTQPEKFIYGDVDLDGQVTVKDATLIQKGLAKITYVNAVQRFLADPEGTGYSVKNATAIQKYLAKYETSIPWETEIPMTSENEFSGDVSANSDFKTDEITVRIKDNDGYIYTVKDFSEYNFSKVIKWEYDDNTYSLYLEESGKENVIEALKALDYRANIDLAFVSPNFISYQDQRIEEVFYEKDIKRIDFLGYILQCF